jgi:hypothetical protein
MTSSPYLATEVYPILICFLAAGDVPKMYLKLRSARGNARNFLYTNPIRAIVDSPEVKCKYKYLEHYIIWTSNVKVSRFSNILKITKQK